MPRRRQPNPPPTKREAEEAAFLGATPKPYHGPITPTAEEFAAWCEQPVTRWVAACYSDWAENMRQTWLRDSWDSGSATPELLLELRVRADCYRAFLETDHERYTHVAATKE